MKNLFFLAVATIALTACNSEDINIDDESLAARITGTIEQGVVSRASETLWSVGDSIGVTMIDDRKVYINIRHTAESSEGTFTGSTMYFKNKREPVAFIAYYTLAGTEGTADSYTHHRAHET